MRRARLLRPILATVAVALASAGCGGAASPSTALTDIGAGLHGPAGLRATTLAVGVAHAAVATTDERGRVFVATAAFEDSGTDRVVMIDHAGATPVTVLDSLHTPLGLLWIGDELLVAAKGGVVAHGGFDGTRFGTARTVVSLPDDLGEVNGLAHHPDGRVLVGVSAACDHCTPGDARSGAILAFDPRGAGTPTIYASAIRAPIALAFATDTAELFVTIDHRDDLGDRTPGDWLATVAEGSSWGFPECWGQGGDACRGVPAPVAALDPHAGVIGLALVRDELGPALSSSAVVAEWAGGVVQRVALGGPTRGRVTPLLTGMRNPSAVAIAPDGSLVVADWTTGTVYRVARDG